MNGLYGVTYLIIKAYWLGLLGSGATLACYITVRLYARRASHVRQSIG